MNQTNKCVYRKFDNHENVVIICLYVDDILIFGTNLVQVQEAKSFLYRSFQMNDMGETDVILGIKIIRDDSRIKLSQFHYMKKVLKRFSMLDKTLVSNPMEPDMIFSKHTGQPISQIGVFKDIYAMT